jgi:hypothetical protein
MLALLCQLNVEFQSDVETARVIYDAAMQAGSEEPTLDELIAEGRLRIVWGRISTPFELGAGRAASAAKMTAFQALLGKRYDVAYRLSDRAHCEPAVVAVAEQIEKGQLEPRAIGCRSPEWVAARLWEHFLRESPARVSALRLWIDRWELLSSPSLVPGLVWDETAAGEFRQGALEVLRSEPSLTGWDETRANFVAQIALRNGQPPADAEGFIPRIPAALVDRALWLQSHHLERMIIGSLREFDDVFGLARLLLDDIEAANHAQAPHKLAADLFALAVKRPELLAMLIFRLQRSPVLLADALLNPETSALACLLIGEWQSASGAWERELTDRDNRTTKRIAFTDAVAVMGEHLEQDLLRPEEAGALVSWLHRTAPLGFIDDLENTEDLLGTLRGELVRQTPETLAAIVSGLTANEPGLGSSDFAAALDIVDAGGLVGRINPEPLVLAYSRSIAAGDYNLSVRRIGIGAAAALFEAASATPELRQAFLRPFDVRVRLAAVGDENPFSLAESVARSLRAHMRVLSRAIAGSVEVAPDDLVQALTAAVRAGAVKHDEKGRVAAFAPRHEVPVVGQATDRPIAADLGLALGTLIDADQERLLTAILDTDEPMFLAQLLSFAPYVMRTRIEARIRELTPVEAAAPENLTEAQARIEALLTAEQNEAAASFIDAERDLKTLGPVGGRRLTQLRTQLRLHLARQEWDAIKGTTVSADFSAGERPLAEETLNFYKALGALQNPADDTRVAEHMFAQLHARHTTVPAYAVNLVAARISLLLGDNSFARLRGTGLARGRRILAEAESMMLHVRGATSADREAFNANKALLLLALGQSDQAYQLLVSLGEIGRRGTIAAYSAVALHRMGRGEEAATILAKAENVLGLSDVLRAAREQIDSGKAFVAAPETSSETDPVDHITHAFLHFKELPPDLQAKALYRRAEALDVFVLEHIRSATAVLVDLAPRLKQADFNEDDLTALLCPNLGARIEFAGWSAHEQSPGGITAKETTGRRDLVLKKGSTTLAVIEAVLCKRPVTHEWTRLELASHFQRVVTYSTCRLFFHLTYAYIDDPATILPQLKHSAEHDAPSHYSFQTIETFPLTDSRPVGFAARYAGPFGEIRVTFLVLDMQLAAQFDAAETAAATNPRNKGAKSKGRTKKPAKLKLS